MSSKLAVIDPTKYAILASPDVIQDVTETIEENLAGGTLGVRNLTKLSVPAGGGTAWSVPTPEGDKNMDAVTGVIILQQPRRVYFSKAFGEGENNTPDCQSNDALTGIGVRFPQDIQTGERAHDCTTCPLSKWGADRTPPPCNERRRLYMLRESDMLPIYIDLPPTSLKPLGEYMNRLTQAGLRYYYAITSIGLQRVPKEGARPQFSIIACQQVGTITEPAQREALRGYKAAIQQLVTMPINVEDTVPSTPVEDMEEIDI